MNRVVVDTNVFIYDFDKSSAHHLHAKKILISTDIELFVTTKNISEFFAVCSKNRSDFKLTIKYHQEILTNLIVLYPSQQSLQIFESLISIYRPIGNKVFDLEIVSIMLANNIHQIATFNNKDFEAIKEISTFKF